MADLFRKSALERLSSPEQLDKAITVSKPASWLALLGVLIMVVAVVIWSVLGSLPTSMDVSGIVISTGDGQAGRIVEGFVPHFYATQIQTGMRAVVQSSDGSSRINAEVVSVHFNDTGLSDMELALMSRDIISTVRLRLIDDELPERTLVIASIVVEEITPINMLFPR